MEPKWSELEAGYGLPYDPRPAVDRLRDDPLDQDAWGELWNELHHQGDVGRGSYAALPLVVEACEPGPRDANFYGLVSTIEIERHRRSNPPLPEWLAPRYRSALRLAKALALADLVEATDPVVVRSALALVALVSGAVELGALLAHWESSEIRELLDDQLAWDELYRHDLTP